jgi:uncharacterized protein (TIGR02444 family)
MIQAPVPESMWDRALEIYALPRVQPSCLQLQSEAGIDVVMLLFSLALGSMGFKPLTPGELAKADAMLAIWRRATILPLREIRTKLKPGIAFIAAEDSKRLRQEVQKLEIAAEKVAFDLLLNAYPASLRDSAATGWTSPAVEAVIEHFSANSDKPGTQGMSIRIASAHIVSALDKAHFRI